MNAARCEASCTLSVNTSVFFSAVGMSGLAKTWPSAAEARVATLEPRKRMPSASPQAGHSCAPAASSSGVTSTGTHTVRSVEGILVSSPVSRSAHQTRGSLAAPSPGAKIHAR